MQSEDNEWCSCMTHSFDKEMHEPARMLAIWENHKILVWSKIAFVANFHGHSQNTSVVTWVNGQRELANWMQHPKMSNGCSVEVSTAQYARLRRERDVLHPQCAVCDAQIFFQLAHSLLCTRFELFRFEAVFAFCEEAFT